jgi:hypothetical protein
MKFALRSLLLLFFVGTGIQNCRAELSEVQIQSAYVFNFIKFSEWPATTLKPGDKLRVCVIGNDGIHATLTELDGRKAGEFVLQVMPLFTERSDFKTCHVLYIDEQEQRRFISILKSLGEVPMLTISDIPDFAERGGCIGLLNRDNKILFEVNLASTRKAGLRLSSQMLNLAANIFGK